MLNLISRAGLVVLAVAACGGGPSRSDDDPVAGVCRLSQGSTTGALAHVRRRFGERERDAARTVLTDRGVADCWGGAALVLAAEGRADELGRLDRAIDEMATLTRDEIGYRSAGELLLAVGYLAQASTPETAAAATAMLAPRAHYQWWLARLKTDALPADTATGRVLMVLSALSLTGTSEAAAVLQRVATDSEVPAGVFGDSIRVRAKRMMKLLYRDAREAQSHEPESPSGDRLID